MAEIDQLRSAIAGCIGCAPPSRYIGRIAGIEQAIIVGHPRLPNRSWRISPPNALLSDTRVDRHKGAEWETVSLFGKMLADVGIAELNGNPRHPTDFLRQTVTFAHDNGDFLFLRPDSGVWVFHHDGHEVEKIVDSYEAFDESAKWPRARELGGVPLNEWESRLVGRWRPIASNTETDPEFFEDTKHDLILGNDRTAQLVFIDETSEETWFADAKRFTFTLQGHEIAHSYKLTEETLEVTTLKFGDHTRYERSSG